jgi:hypothetical protein
MYRIIRTDIHEMIFETASLSEFLDFREARSFASPEFHKSVICLQQTPSGYSKKIQIYV